MELGELSWLFGRCGLATVLGKGEGLFGWTYGSLDERDVGMDEQGVHGL